MTQITTRLEWLRARLSGIGSSDAPVLVLGKLFGRTPVHVYIDKTRTPDQVIDNDGEHDDNLRRGNTYEPIAIEKFRALHGAQVWAPTTDAERYNDYRRTLPYLPAMYADFDGATTDEWVVECKAPLQFVCDKIRENGLKDYYQIQAQQLAHVAFAVGTPAFGPGLCKGTIVVVYEPERACVQIVRVPRDPEMGANLERLIGRFWQEHVIRRVPPLEWGKNLTLPTPAPKGVKDKYTPVIGAAWDEAVHDLLLAKDLAQSAERREAAAKAVIQSAMALAELDRVAVGGVNLSFAVQQGRKAVNLALLAAEHPEIDLTKYEERGDSFRSFRVYPPKRRATVDDAAGMDEALTTLSGELEQFARADLDAEAATVLFDDLRARADVYAAMLRSELSAIEIGMERAAAAAVVAALGTGAK